MKKHIKVIILLFLAMILSLSVQTAVLYYMNNYYLSRDTKVTYKQVIKKNITKKNEIKIQNGASNIKLSPSGKYCSYYCNNNVNVINLDNGSINTLQLDNDINSCYFRWNNSEDNIIISKKTIENGKPCIRIYNYDAKQNIKREALNYNNTSQAYVLPVSDANIADIEPNTMNTILYFKTGDSKNINHLTRLDISDAMSEVPSCTQKIGSFFVLRQKDELIYENLQDGKTYITQNAQNTEVKINNNEKSKLLYVDKDDNVYIGLLKNNAITQIYKSNFGDNAESKPQIINLQDAVETNNIHISYSGNIYTIDNLKHCVKDIESNIVTKYNGIFLDLNDEGILSIDNSMLLITKFK